MKPFLLNLFLLLSLTISAQKPELGIPFGHTGHITSLSFSADGQLLLSASYDGSLKLWDVKSGKLLKTTANSNQWTFGAKLSPDGKYASYMWSVTEALARLWDIEKDTIHNTGDIAISSFSANSIYIRDPERKKFRELPSGKVVDELYPFNPDNFTPDGKLLYKIDIDQIQLWNPKSKQPVDTVTGNQLRLWDVQSKQLLKTVTLEGPTPSNYQFSDNVQFLIDRTALKLNVWELNNGRLKHSYNLSTDLSVIGFTADGNSAVLMEEDGSLRLVNLIDGKVLVNYKLPDKSQREFFMSPPDAKVSPDGTLLAVGTSIGLIHLFDLKSGHLLKTIRGHTFAANFAQFSLDGKSILYGAKDALLRVWNLEKGKVSQTLGKGGNSGSYGIGFAQLSENKALVTYLTEQVQLWNMQDANVNPLKAASQAKLSLFIGHSADGRFGYFSDYHPERSKYIITAWDLEGDQLTQSVEDVHLQTISPNKALGLVKEWNPEDRSKSVLAIWDLTTLKPLKKLEKFNLRSDFSTFSSDSKKILFWEQYELTSPSTKLSLWDIETEQLVQTFTEPGHYEWTTAATFSTDGQYLVTGTWDQNINVFDVRSGKAIHTFSGHKGQINSVSFSKDDKWLLSTSDDGTVKIWDFKTKKEVATLINVDQRDWIVTTPSGLFDASPNAMNEMYYKIDRQIIDLEQLKGRYWEPGLLAKLMGYNQEDVRKAVPLENLNLYPEVKPSINGNQLNIQLKERNGGIGKVSIWVNGKMVEEDINPERKTTIQPINLSSYQQYFLEENIITIRAYDRENWLPSPPAELTYPEKYAGSKGGPVLKFSAKKKRGKVSLYGLIVGTRDYSNDALDLKFSDQDAKAMAQAIKESASALWGANKVTIKLLTTDPENRDLISNKENVQKVLAEFKTQAKAGDILLVYFSGHGKAYQSPGEEQPEFYYLTKDVTSDDLSDTEVRKNYAISSAELSEWINAVPALYQVMIIDACNSGTVVDILRAGKKATSSNQLRAIDRMKDRTGMNVLVGSASNKVSFEASEYGQGLLTYSLLLGMNGAALRKDGPDQFVDVGKLFNFATEQVGILAANIGEVQQPQPLLGASFDLGIVDNTVKIPLAKKKPVFIRSTFQEKDLFGDDLELSPKLNQYLQTATAKGSQAKMIFIDVGKYENAYSIRGQYTIEGDVVKVEGRLFKGKERLDPFQVSGSKNEMEGLVQKIIEKAESLIK